MYFDTHAHYYDDAFDPDRDALLASLPARGLALAVCPGCDLASSAASVALAERYDFLYAAVGFHPENLEGAALADLDQVRALAAHRATMVLFLSTSLTEKLQEDLLAGGYEAQTPAAVVYKATWPEEKIFRCTVGTLHRTVTENGLTKTSLIVVGGCLGDTYLRSLLYHPGFTTEFREATQ